MTIPEQPRKLTLQEQLALERQQKEQPVKTNPPIIPPQVKIETPLDITSEADLKTLSARIEYESKLEGYHSFKEREAALKDGEKELEAEALELGEERKKFEVEQTERVRIANAELERAKKAMDLYKTKIADADAKMSKAQNLQAEADRVLKAQSEAEKEASEKQKAYEANMEECLDLFLEIATVLNNNGNPKVSSTGRILQCDLALIQRMQQRGVHLSSIADVIAGDCGRLDEICEFLQDNPKVSPNLLNYLTNNVEFIESSLHIEWQPSNVEVLT